RGAAFRRVDKVQALSTRRARPPRWWTCPGHVHPTGLWPPRGTAFRRVDKAQALSTIANLAPRRWTSLRQVHLQITDSPQKDSRNQTMSDAQPQDVLDKAVAEGGAYEVLQRRLQEQGQRLRGLTDALNVQRLEVFGTSRMEVIGRVRIRSENNCVARDIVQVGDCLLFGYNVFLGLKQETRIEDVFSLYRLSEQAEGYEAEPVPLAGTFLAQQGFVNDFNE